MKKSFTAKGAWLLGGLMCVMALPAAGATTVYADYADAPQWWGTYKAETYQVGTYLSGERFSGLTLNEITFPVRATEGVGDFSVWVATNLDLKDSEFTPDVVSREVSVGADGKASIKLDSPYEIGADGVYIGYSFTVTARDTEEQQSPVAVIKEKSDPNGHGIYVLASRTFSKWNTVAGGAGTFVPFEITVGGIGENAVQYEVADEVNAGVGKWVELPVKLYNCGIQPVKSVELTYNYSDGREQKKEFELDTPIPGSLFAAQTAKLPLNGLMVKGDDEVTVKVTGVNGSDNAYSGAEQKSKVAVWSYVPVRRPLLEEYTATDCGFCPRGALGLEKLMEKYGDMIVAVSYHSKDVMAVITPEEFPNPAPAQPTLWIDRMRETDPYFGDRIKEMAFGAPEVWEVMQDRFTPADISFDCDWESVSSDKLELKGEVTFVAPVKNQMELVCLVVADGLSKGDPTWFQSNYYQGQTGIWPSDFDYLVEGPNPIMDAVYNDVVIMTRSYGLYYADVEDIDADETFPFEVSLDLQEAKNLDGELLLQDRSKLRVVVAVYDGYNGEVLNCRELRYGASGVTELEADEAMVAPESVSYYNLQGMQVSAPVAGEITVEVTRGADGKVSTRKLVSPRR